MARLRNLKEAKVGVPRPDKDWIKPKGCYNCGSVEVYNGYQDDSIRYLCVHCTQSYSLVCLELFQAAEDALKALKPKRWNRKPISKLKGKTLATC